MSTRRHGRSRRRRNPAAAPLAILALWAIASAPAYLGRFTAPKPPSAATAFASELLETLTYPSTLPNRSSLPQTVEVNLVAEPARLSLIPGNVQTFFAFNGEVPGPTLEVNEGDRVIVHFHNKLPEPTTVHWHGLPVPVEADGNPMDPVAPGGSYDYVFTVPKGTAGTYWYHPHPHGKAGRQVSRGLFGALIVRGADDPLRASIPEKLLLLTDARVSSRGTIIFPVTLEHQGWEGNTLFVNGRREPTIALRAGEIQRWRVINASVSRYYRLALQDHTFEQIGSDGGLFERRVPRDEIVLAPADRVELLVRGTGNPGGRYLLQSLPYDRYLPGLQPEGWERTLELLTVRYASDPPITPPSLPEVLRPVPALDPAHASTTRHVILHDALINYRFFNPNRVDFTARLNDTEVWTIENRDGMDHPFHLHGFSFQVLDRNGVREPFPAWEDTVNIPKGASLRFVVRYDDYPGKRMFHCHIMDHEDWGMMGILEVR